MKLIDRAVESDLFREIDKDLIDRFVRYHTANPHVYSEFKHNATAMRRSGRQKYSAWSIINKIRWDYDITTSGDVFEINNDFIALYARLLIFNDPVFRSFFELRKMKSNDRKMSQEEKTRRL